MVIGFFGYLCDMCLHAIYSTSHFFLMHGCQIPISRSVRSQIWFDLDALGEIPIVSKALGGVHDLQCIHCFFLLHFFLIYTLLQYPVSAHMKMLQVDVFDEILFKIYWNKCPPVSWVRHDEKQHVTDMAQWNCTPDQLGIVWPLIPILLHIALHLILPMSKEDMTKFPSYYWEHQ